MQICGKSVDLEEIKTAQAELEALMSDPATLSQMEAKTAELTTKLNNFKPEIPALPNLQQALSDLGSKTNSTEMQAALKQLKQDFGTVVDNLDELIEKVNPKINELLNTLPDASTLVAVADGSLVGEALTNALQKIATAEAKLARQLAVGGLPTVDDTTICNEVPNIEVQTVTESVTVADVTTQVETKKKVELPAEPIVPKAVPVASTPKPVQTQVTIDTQRSSVKALMSSQKAAIRQKREELTKRFYPPNGDFRAVKERSETEFTTAQRNFRKHTLAHVWWYQFEVLKALGESDIEKRSRLYPASFRLSVEEAQSLVAESNRKDLYNSIKTLYETSQISLVVKFEDALANHYKLRNAQGGLATVI